MASSRLTDATSPYLRAHAGNPVEWFPWGAEAFEVAARRDVPVLVSIGYSTCHWCHVMARESFEDAATAAQINEGFVAIKVDREEHPDVDAAYLAAASAFTPNLGWPLTVFTTPEGRAFYAGTYWPPEAHSGAPAFRDVLAAVREAWVERRAEVGESAAALAEALAQAAERSADATELPSQAVLAEAARALAAAEDPEHGGFGTAPKFPVATALRLLQARAIREAAAEASAVADRALAAMAASELRDPVEGGFFRYATRRDWSVPHYERMLVDNAQLLEVATDAADADTSRGVARFLIDVLQQPSGGFGSAQDSESWIDGVRSEGGYYALDAAARAALDGPSVDGKVVTGWNGLAIGALARAGERWGEPAWIESAACAADSILANHVTADGRLIRASLDEVASRASATLADYGQLAGGLFALAVATGEAQYAVRARALVDACLDLATPGSPRAPGGGDPVLTAQAIAPPDDASDGDQPSGPAAMADAAFRAWLLGAGESYRTAARAIVATHAARALAQPLAHAALLRVAAELGLAPRQLVVVDDRRDGALAAVARTQDAEVVAIASPAQADAFASAGFSLFEAKVAGRGIPTAYDCRDFVCRLPITDPAELAEPQTPTRADD